MSLKSVSGGVRARRLPPRPPGSNAGRLPLGVEGASSRTLSSCRHLQPSWEGAPESRGRLQRPLLEGVRDAVSTSSHWSEEELEKRCKGLLFTMVTESLIALLQIRIH